MKRKAVLFFFLAITSLYNYSYSQTNNNTTDTAIININNFLEASGVSGGVLIARNGTVLLRKGYGFADENQNVELSTTTVFDIGSVTKQFTAAAVLKLEQQSKLKTTDSITKYFKNVPAEKQFITVHQLLTHTAGFKHDVIDDTISNRDEAVKRTLQSKLKFPAGTQFSYSNAGYGLLAAIIEIASGMSYENYLFQNLWKPAGMLQTGNLLPQWNKKVIAHTYDFSGEINRPVNELWGNDGPSWITRGSGAVLSTLEDLYKWELALEGEVVLSNASKQKLFSPYASFKDVYGTSSYAYGWAVSKTPRGTTLIEHNGGNGYHFTDFYRYVDEGVTILYFTNERHTMSLPILDSLPGFFFNKVSYNFPTPKTVIKDLKKFTGIYQLPSGNVFEVVEDHDVLAVKALTPGAGKWFTNDQQQNDLIEEHDIESRVDSIIKNVTDNKTDNIRELIYVEGSFEDEKKYWQQTADNWTQRFGKFIKSEVVGKAMEAKVPATYVLLQFEKGNVLVQCRQYENKQLYIGTLANLLPRYYRFIPQSADTFLVYNYLLKTSISVEFVLDGKSGSVQKLAIQNDDKKIFAKKIK